MRSAFAALFLVPALALFCGPAANGFAASSESEKERRVAEQYRQCIEACRKHSPKPGNTQADWTREIREEARVDACEHHCDRLMMRGFRK
ncbi:hypothetical protein [Fundidesulfovibrio agrisoli]|uniref:hypothetical protein n=1 Tax=Fundidesulfovibrio agrisoli TaxID=2922717 RepID=UPI001FAD244D|nr:hypothetical protein [Fundidesulfovibrio agrisoli]